MTEIGWFQSTLMVLIVSVAAIIILGMKGCIENERLNYKQCYDHGGRMQRVYGGSQNEQCVPMNATLAQ